MRSEIDNYIYEMTKGIVQSGPFAGMKLSNDTSWSDGAYAPMLLGCHEEELHKIIELEIERLAEMTEPNIVNLGCAEGYYAVGMARRLPKAKVWVKDISEQALDITFRNAASNDVNCERLDDLDRMCAFPDLVISDCEGGELDYLDPVKFIGLTEAHMIVELHATGDTLLQRWIGTHNVVGYREGARDPNQFLFLQDKPSIFRWAAMCENRPCMMMWFHLWPKEA